MIAFISGILIGGTVAVFTMCLFVAGKEEEK